MKQTALIEKHRQANGKLVDFFGWEMPLHYEAGVVREHLAVRSLLGLFDVSHMGDFLIKDRSNGKELQNLLTNNITDIADGKAVYTHLTDDGGRIIDDLIVTKLSDNGDYFCVPNASMTDIVRDWMIKNSNFEIIDLSMGLACIAVQGPKSKEVLISLFGEDIAEIKKFSIKVYDFGERKFIDLNNLWYGGLTNSTGIISSTGYTGEEGFELIIPNQYAPDIWDLIFQKEPNTLPIGLGARDTLRLEMGYLLSGQDFSRDRTPLETNCSWVVKWDHDFIGKKILEEMRESKDYQKMIGINLDSKAPARTGATVHLPNSPQETMGSVSSGNYSPSLGHSIALAYLDREHYGPDLPVELEHHGRRLEGITTKTPFIKKK